MNPARMTRTRYLSCRKAYRYPAVGLRTPTEGRTFLSVSAMEVHFKRLLRSTNAERVLLGYLSVIYWGHYLGSGGKPNPSRAHGKVKLARSALKHKGLNAQDVALLIRSAASSLSRGRPILAMKLLMQLPQFGFAFASKACTFLDASRYGVIDKVIARKYPRFQFKLTKGGYVSSAASNFVAYRRYCKILTQNAARLNYLGRSYYWQERSGRRLRWRAIDVERALYAS